jgi:hypothetical protein
MRFCMVVCWLLHQRLHDVCAVRVKLPDQLPGVGAHSWIRHHWFRISVIGRDDRQVLGVQRVQLHGPWRRIKLQPQRRLQPAHHLQPVHRVAVLQHQHICMRGVLSAGEQQRVRHCAVHLLHRHRLCHSHQLRCGPVSKHCARDWQLDAAWCQRRVLAVLQCACWLLLF